MTNRNDPFVSVVVCVYNGEQIIHNGNSVLLSCLDSLANQTYPPQRYEVLIIDDGSSDDTYNQIANFLTTQKEVNVSIKLVGIRHGGLSVARNSAIRMSRGEVIAFIDQDAIPNQDWLTELIKPFLSGADYVGGRINLLNTETWIARFLQLTRFRQFFGPTIYNHQFVGCNMALRKSVFDVMGGFHENFISYGDESTLVQRICNTYRYAPAPDAVVYHEQPDNLISFLRITWKSASLFYLSQKSSGSKISWKQLLLIIEQFFITVSPVFLCLLLINPRYILIPALMSALAIFHRTFINPLNKSITTGLISEYGILRGIFGSLLYQISLNMVVFLGTVLSPWLQPFAAIIPPMSRELEVLRSMDVGISK